MQKCILKMSIGLHAYKYHSINKYNAIYRLHKEQPEQLFSIRFSKSIFLMLFLNDASEGFPLILVGSFAHRCGPKYLSECFPK